MSLGWAFGGVLARRVDWGDLRAFWLAILATIETK